MKKLISALLAAAMLLSLAACGEAEAAPTDSADVYVFTDDLGREVTAPAHPQRVAAMIGSFADVWCLAGGRDTLVAAADDSWTSFDLGLGEDVVNLGAIKEPSLEALIAAEPDYIFVVLQGSDPTDAMETLEQTLLQNPAWSELQAVREGRFYTLEHELYNLKPNARWGEAYEKLADILYPDAG